MALYAVMTDPNTILISNLLSTRTVDVSDNEIIELLRSYNIKDTKIIPILSSIMGNIELYRIGIVSSGLYNMTVTEISHDTCSICNKHKRSCYHILNTQYAQTKFVCECDKFGRCFVCGVGGVIPSDYTSGPLCHFHCVDIYDGSLITCKKCYCKYIPYVLNEDECPVCDGYKYDKCLTCGFYIGYHIDEVLCKCSVEDNCYNCKQWLDEYTTQHPIDEFEYKFYKPDKLCNICYIAGNSCVICGMSCEIDLTPDICFPHTSLFVSDSSSDSLSGGILSLRPCGNFYASPLYITDGKPNEQCYEFIRKNSYLRSLVCKCIYSDKINPECRYCTDVNFLYTLTCRRSKIGNKSLKFCSNCIKIELV